MHLKTALITSFFIVGCQVPNVPKAPFIKEVFEVDAVRNECVPYPVVKQNPITIGDPGQSLEMIACDGYVAIKYSDFQDLIRYQKELTDYANKHKACFLSKKK